ncbi:MAG: lysylphosphatidylglycerol synthase transmembrane domain-containing protein [Gemmatimonadales bacterium]
MSRRTWITALLIVVGAGLTMRFGLNFPWAKTLRALRDADWLLLAAASVVNIASLAAKGTAWYLMLRRLGPSRHATAQAATFVGAAVNSISVSVSGEATRAQLVSAKDGISFGAAVASLVTTRVVEALGLIVFLGVALVALPPWPWARLVGFGLCALVAGLALGYRIIPWERLLTAAAGRRHEPFVRMLAMPGRAGLSTAVVLTTLSWLAQWVTYQWTIEATQTPVTSAASLATLVVANFAGILRLTPGNIGVLQGSLILVMREFHIPPANALAAGLALQAVQVLPILAIGIAIAGARGLRGLTTAPAS